MMTPGFQTEEEDRSLLILPRSLEWLKKWMKQNDLYDDSIEYELIAGKGQYNGLAWNDAEVMQDLSFVKDLSREIDHEIYLIFFQQIARNRIEYYHHGKRKKVVRAPDFGRSQKKEYDFANSLLGIELDGTPKELIDVSTEVFIIEGVKADAVRTAIADKIEKAGKNLVLEDKEKGCLCYMKQGVRNPKIMYFYTDIMSTLPDYRTITFFHNGKGVFNFYIQYGDSAPTIYVYPVNRCNYFETIDSIDGKTDPKEILELFDIPPELLGL